MIWLWFRLWWKKKGSEMKVRFCVVKEYMVVIVESVNMGWWNRFIGSIGVGCDSLCLSRNRL